MIRLALEETKSLITNINNGVEKHGPDEKQVRFDIDVVQVVPIVVLNRLAIDCNINYEAMFYDDKGVLNQSGVLELKFDRKYEEHRAKLSMDTITKECIILSDVTVKKFSAILDSNKQVKLKFQIQCYANDEALLFLRQALIKDSILVEIEEPLQQDLLEED